VIDGRPRGKLPLGAPVRVLPGRHVVRVIKDGYATYEQPVDVAVNAVAAVDAQLAPLAGAGFLRVEDPRSPGSDVFVDRVKVGASPWEGTLGPGRHIVWTARGGAGAPPSAVTVLEGQTTLVRVSSVPVGAPVRLEAQPEGAALAIDGLALGTGIWEVRLGP